MTIRLASAISWSRLISAIAPTIALIAGMGCAVAMMRKA
eukprot:CAMPEP_0169325398 /NCGR_PEP_ID=MMETSP1017-20121227/10969_2 /TAXON_ID=342587 /ORGANISM="Karlodinium micrum, Strain CCMP2283" /LENGTH=38 /DNA_ID= /DNA_START= /DNA_END= /DNA_ORIENTATION=